MEISIRELLDGLEDSSVPMEEPGVVSAMKIKELTIMRIEKKETYYKPENKASPVPMRIRRLMLIAAVITMILAMCVSAYAIYTHWSRGLEHMITATDEEKQMAEESGLSDTTHTVNAMANGVTISVEQTIIDRDTAHIALRIEGFTFPEGQYPDIGGWSLTFDGERAPNMTGGFVEERDDNDRLIFTAPDGSMEFDFTAKAGGKWASFEGKEIRLTLESLGTGDKGQYQALVEGPWELVWMPSASSELLTVHPDSYIGDTGVKLIQAEISPISAKVMLHLPELWDGYKTLDDYDLQLVGVRLKDGTEYVNIYLYPMQVGYTDIDNLILELDYSSHQILQPEQVDTLIFASNIPWARTLTDDDLIMVAVH